MACPRPQASRQAAAAVGLSLELAVSRISVLLNDQWGVDLGVSSGHLQLEAWGLEPGATTYTDGDAVEAQIYHVPLTGDGKAGKTSTNTSSMQQVSKPQASQHGLSRPPPTSNPTTTTTTTQRAYWQCATTATTSQQAYWQWCAKCACLFFGGAAVCHANRGVHDLSASAMYTISFQPTAPGQADWRWCRKCQVLSFTGGSSPTLGLCRAGGQHDISGSGNYRLVSSGGGQAPWRGCRKCHGLAWQPAPCVEGGKHDLFGSGVYHLCINGAPRAQAVIGQGGWRWCRDCQLLCFDGATSCAAGGAHISVGSGNYAVSFAPAAEPAAQAGWKWCSKCYGLVFSEGDSAGVCPRGGAHGFGGSGDYTVLVDVPAGSGQQDGWAWCRNCQQLWYTDLGDGRCASSVSGGHVKEGSGAYVVSFAA